MNVPEPNADIYDFRNSSISYEGTDESVVSDLSNVQFIPRGSTIKFSGQVFALVVYTGAETKLMQNLGTQKSKRSQMQGRVTWSMITNLIILALLVLTGSIWNGLQTRHMYDKHGYIFADLDVNATEISLLTVISLYLVCNFLMTLDLAVMLELVAIFYSPFVSIDAKMMKANDHLGTIETAKMNSLNLIENLGEIEYIMSDKTGTLTKNELTMVAAYCCE